MLKLKCLSINENGRLCIGGVDTLNLAEEYGTPLYVMDESTIRESCRVYKNAIKDYYSGRGLPLFAGKSMSCKEIFRIIASEGMGLDVVSSGELYTALKAGFPTKRIQFHGNNKTPMELEMALDNNIGRIVVDNINELKTLSEIALDRGIKAKILLRIKPGIEAHTHSFIRTGQIDSKFGFALETGEALEAVKMSISLKGLELIGIHCHIGSQILDKEPFIHAASVMMDFISTARESAGILLGELNLGGGFGIRYSEDDKEIDYRDYMRQVLETVKSKALRLSIPEPYIYVEPGRSIVGETGITLYRAGAIKEIPGIRTYVSVDGGMTDNPRYALYQSKYSIVNASRVGDAPDKYVTIAGKCCESGDIIQKDTLIKSPEVGDIIAALCTGAYNYSMASNYNRIPKPAVIMVKSGTSRIIVKRQTLDNIIENDV